MSKPRNIVLLTTWFPPMNGVAVNRMEAIEMYWKKEAATFNVITLQAEDKMLAKVLFIKQNKTVCRDIFIPSCPTGLLDIVFTEGALPGSVGLAHGVGAESLAHGQQSDTRRGAEIGRLREDIGTTPRPG